MYLIKILILFIATLLWLYGCFQAANKFNTWDTQIQILVCCLLLISLIAVIGAIWDMMNGRCTNNNCDSPQKSASFELYQDIEHGDIYRIVSDNTLEKMYPGLQTKEPSLHNTEMHGQIVSSKPSPPNKSRRSIWSILYNKFKTAKPNKSKRHKSEINTALKPTSRRSVPPPPPRTNSAQLPPPPRRNTVIPPPPPAPTPNRVPVTQPKTSVPPPPPPDAIPSQMPSKTRSLNNALLQDIHKGKTLKPSAEESFKPSNKRQSLLQQIQKGKTLRKSTIKGEEKRKSTEIMNEMDELTPWDRLSRRVESMRPYFNQEDDLQSSFSARSSSKWFD